jgi:hypothetical protein
MGFQFSGRIGGFILPFRLKKEETSSPQSASFAISSAVGGLCDSGVSGIK